MPYLPDYRPCYHRHFWRNQGTPMGRKAKRKMKQQRPYTIREVLYLKEHYPRTQNEALARQMGRTVASVKSKGQELGLKKCPDARRSFLKRKPAWNKGRPFKKGQQPHNARPVGEKYLRKDHGQMLWFIKPKGRNRIMPYHQFRWEQLNGPIPPGHVVAFRDGDTMNTTDNNLVLLTRGELMRRNTKKCDCHSRSLAAWRSRSGASLVEQVLMQKI